MNNSNKMNADNFLLCFAASCFLAFIVVFLFAFALGAVIDSMHYSFFKDVRFSTFEYDFFAALSGNPENGKYNQEKAVFLGNLLRKVPSEELDFDLRAIAMLNQAHISYVPLTTQAAEIQKTIYLVASSLSQAQAKVDRLGHYKKAFEIEEWKQLIRGPKTLELIKSVHAGKTFHQVDVRFPDEWKLFGLFSWGPSWTEYVIVSILVSQVLWFAMFCLFRYLDKYHPLLSLPKGKRYKLVFLLMLPGALPIMVYFLAVTAVRKMKEGRFKNQPNYSPKFGARSLPSTNTRETLDRLLGR